jgi:predicted dehydrogenase
VSTRLALEPVRTAVVGLGYWGPNLARALQELPEAALTHVCDLDPDALARIGRRYPAVELSTDFEEILGDPSIEAVALATPVNTHFRLVSAALEAGKHVFVEKPLASRLADATELVELAAARGLVLLPGHTFLYSPPVNAVKQLIDGGMLGDVFFISMSRVNLGLHQRDVSVVWDLGPHDFSILGYWLGEAPSHVTALSRSCVLPQTPDVAFINLEFPSRTIAHVELSWLAPSKLRRTTIVGSDSMVVYDDTSNEPVRIFDSGVNPPAPETFGEYRLTYRSGDIVSPRIVAAEPLSLEMTDFCTCIRTGARPRSSAQVGLDVVRTIEAVDASLESGTRVGVEETADSILGSQAADLSAQVAG